MLLETLKELHIKNVGGMALRELSLVKATHANQENTGRIEHHTGFSPVDGVEVRPGNRTKQTRFNFYKSAAWFDNSITKAFRRERK